MRFPLLILLVLGASVSAQAAGLPDAQRVAVETTVRTEVTKDLSVPYLPWAPDRPGITGQPFMDGIELVEYWADMECAYCGPGQPVAAQKKYQDRLHVIVRHMPAQGQESIKKALIYESLKHFSPNAANMFWDAIAPKTELAMPVPYAAAMQDALMAAAIDQAAFEAYLGHNATQTIHADLAAAKSRITFTPTYVILGIRFSGCDFTADELLAALELAQKARAGDSQAKDEIIQIITREQLEGPEA